MSECITLTYEDEEDDDLYVQTVDGFIELQRFEAGKEVAVIQLDRAEAKQLIKALKRARVLIDD